MVSGEDFFKDKNDEFSGGGRVSLSDSPSERAKMIEEIFQEVLGRKPSSRESAFYKYGVMKPSDIRLKLIKSEEHKKILEKANRVPGLEEELKDLRISERKLVQSREDLKAEMISSQSLLEEKNILIKELREQVNNPYDFPSQIERFESGFDVFHTKRPNTETRNENVSIKSILERIINLLFK